MDTKEMLKKIEQEIAEAAPAFDPSHALKALDNTNVYLFRYFPKLKMIVTTERLCQDFHIEPVYHNIPISFSKDFVIPEDQEKFENMYYAIDNGAKTATVDFRGKIHGARCRVTLTVVEWDENHKPELATGVVEDRTKEELTNEELTSILSSISCGVLQYRHSDNTLLRANKAALDILGYNSFEEIATDREYGVAMTVIPEDRSYIHDIVDSLEHIGEVRTIEYRVRHKDSDQLRHCYGTVQIFENVYGERIVQRTIMDITDRKLKEDMQHTNYELMQRINTVMNGISGGFEITLDDPVFTYTYVSENVAALQGYTVEELLSACNGNAYENIHPDDRDRVVDELKKVTWNDDGYTIKYRLFHKNGQIIWVTETGKKVIDKDGGSLFYCLIQDITESEKQTEDLSHLLTMQRQMVSSLSCGVFAYTLPEREQLIANKEAKRIFRHGKNNPRPLIQTIFDHISPEDRTDIHEATKRLQKVGDSCTYKLHPLMEDGTRLTVECYTKLRAFDDGHRFILSVLSDITEAERRTRELNELNQKQKEMLSEIRMERQQYRDALLSGSEYAYRFDVTDNLVTSDFEYSVRGSLQENLGITVPVSFDVMVQHWRDTMQPEFLSPEEQNPMTAAEIQACYDRGMTHIVTEYFNPTENKYFRRTFLLSIDELTGHLVAIAIVHDITNTVQENSRKRNELAMINRDLMNHIQISKAFGSIYFATWEVDLETEHMSAISVPDWAERIEKDVDGDFRKAAEIITSSYVKEDSKETMRQFINLDDMAARLKGKSILACEYEGAHYDWCTACLIPYMHDEDGNVLKTIFAVREISNEKRIELDAKHALEDAYEAANRANAAKTEFLSSVSHDIRTPMNGIIGMTAIAATHLDDQERVADCLSKISVSSKHLLGLINEVLDMNKIESGKLDLNAEEFSLSDLVDALLIMSKSQIESKKHQLFVNIHNVEHENVIGDSLRLQQVFINLLSNAVKYTPAGGTITLGLSEKNTNNPKIGCFEFVIEDNGIGMSKEFQKHLFEPFSRAIDQRIEKIQGSGLGMPIARNIIRMMNGDIQVESELSKGTKITVQVFLELQVTDEQFSAEEFIDLPILVADDDEVACESTCLVLNELGMKGEWVLSGGEAVQKTVERHQRNDDYFAVILDWKMPDMDGLATAKEIRRQVGEDVPIIIISAYDWSDIEREARLAGVNAFLSKPVFKSRLSYLFKSLLGKESEQAVRPATSDLTGLDLKGKRALLAEDNELNAEIAMELLGITGLEIDHAQDGREAVDFLSAHPDNYYDIIFMDIQMPIMDGYEATRAIRSLPGNYAKRIPILAMTANAFAEDVQAAKRAGMNEHIAKPLNIAQLTKALEYWMK